MTYHVHAFSDILGLEDALDDLNGKIDDHIADLDNPHQTTIPKLDDTSIINPTPGQGLFLADDGVTWVNRASFTESWPTGLANGGELNIGPGPNDIEVIAGAGVVIDSYTDPDSPPVSIALTWNQINAAITAVPSVAGNIAWFSIANSGIGGLPIGNIPKFEGELRQYATAPSPTLAREEIFLGVAIYNGITWNEVSSPKVINQSAETLREIATVVLPKSIIIAGGEITEQAGFTLNQAEGTIWENNRNWHVSKSDPNREQLPPATPIVFEPLNRDFSDVLAPTSVIDPTIWDDGGVISAVPGPANTCTIQRLYIDLANNYWLLLGQTLYANWNEAQANRQAYTPEVPFLLQNSLYLGAAIVEKGKNDWDVDEATFLPPAESGGGPAAGTPITTFTGLVDTPSSYAGQFPLVPVVDPTELFLEFDYRTKAVGDYVEGITYNIGDEVFNGSDLSEAKINGVQSYPFVAPTGDTFDIYQGTMPTDAKTAKQVIFGNRYTSVTKGFFINGYRVYTVVGNSYEVVSVTDPLGTPLFTQVASFTGTVNGWFDLEISSVAVAVGTVFDLLCIVSEPDPTPIEVIASYDYETPQNPAVPLAGQITQGRSLPSILSISYTDSVGGDRTALVQGLSIGDKIALGQVLYSVQTNTPQIGYSDVVVAPALTTTPLGIQDVTFETVATTPITIGEDPLYWPTSPFPATQGLLGVDIPYADIVPDDNAYGIDIAVQEAFIPDQTEWQIKIIGSVLRRRGILPGGGATEVTVEQVAHGFGTLDCIRWDGTTWVFAQASNTDTTALGVVVEVISDDAFKYAITGAYDLETPHGLTIDQWYYLSATVAGGLDIDEPVISQPIVYIETATQFSVYAYRPAIAGGEPIETVQTPLGTLTRTSSVVFGTTDVEIPMVAGLTQNPDEYFSWDGSGIVILKDCFVDMAFYFAIELETPTDNRSEGKLYVAVDDVSINNSRGWSYHRIDSVDRTTNAGGTQYAFSAGERVSMRAQVQTGGPLKLVGNTGQLTLTVIDRKYTRGPAGDSFWAEGTDPNDIVNTNSGNVGIGTDTPYSDLTLVNSSNVGNGVEGIRMISYGGLPAVNMTKFLGTPEAPTPPSDGTLMGILTFRGYTGDTTKPLDQGEAFAQIRSTSRSLADTYSNGSADLGFFTLGVGNTGTTERMRITTDGQVLIGTTGEPGIPGTAPLIIKSDYARTQTIDSVNASDSGSVISIHEFYGNNDVRTGYVGTVQNFGTALHAATGFPVTFFTNNAEVGSFTTTGTFIVKGSTAQKASGTTWSNPSDVRLKDNITDYDKGSAELMQIQVREWDYNGKAGTAAGTQGLGVIADEVMKVLPDTVSTYEAKLNPEDKETIPIKQFDATEITWLLVKTVQELTARVEELENE